MPDWTGPVLVEPTVPVLMVFVTVTGGEVVVVVVVVVIAGRLERVVIVVITGRWLVVVEVVKALVEEAALLETAMTLLKELDKVVEEVDDEGIAIDGYTIVEEVEVPEGRAAVEEATVVPVYVVMVT